MPYSDRLILFRQPTDDSDLPTFLHFIVKVVEADRCVALAYVELYPDEAANLKGAAPAAQAEFATRFQSQIMEAYNDTRIPK